MAESLDDIQEDIKREIQEAAESGGVTKLKHLLEKKNNEWKEIPLNIAVTGESGVGKSSFINAFRGITAEDEGGAHVDVVEATMEITPYRHPTNSNMVLWDLPGVGTPNHKRENYLSSVQFKKYDFFLILSAGRFREDDLWLAQEIHRMKKTFYFVRTQIGIDVGKDKTAHPKTHSKDRVIDKVRKDCETNLKGLTEAPFFLIDNYSKLEFDFNALAETLINEAPAKKRDAMVLSMSVLTDGVIEKKREVLQERIFKISLQAAMGRAIPIPGVEAVVELSKLYKEIKFYRSQLGVTDDTLIDYANSQNISRENVKEKLGLSDAARSEESLEKAVSEYRDTSVKQSLLPFAIPIIGHLVSVKHSYGQARATLCHFLNILSEDARKINKAMAERITQQT